MANLRTREHKRSRTHYKQPRKPSNKSWGAFVEWCQFRGLSPVPANPWTVAAYARSMEGKHKPIAIRKRISELANVHKEKTRKRLAHNPMVQRTLEIIERNAEFDKHDSGLFTDDDFFSGIKTKTSSGQEAGREKTKPKKSLKSVRPRLRAQPRLVPKRSLKQ